MSRFFEIVRLLAADWSSQGSRGSPPGTMDIFSPSYADACVVRAMLKSCGLPTELVLEILEWANYEPFRTFTSTQVHTASAPDIGVRLCLEAGVLTKNTLRELAAGQRRVKVKEIEFVFSSRDQGWTSEGTDGTFVTSSWLEVSILRPTGLSPSRNSEDSWDFRSIQSPADFQPMFWRRGQTLVVRPEEAGRGIQDGEGNRAWYLQGNRVASQGNYSEYRVVWAVDHCEGNEGAGDGLGFLEALQEGDAVLVWGRAKYPGWQCVVRSVKMNVRYSFTECDPHAPT